MLLNDKEMRFGGRCKLSDIPDSEVHGATKGPTWVLSDPDGPHVGPMNFAMRDPSGDYLSIDALIPV